MKNAFRIGLVLLFSLAASAPAWAQVLLDDPFDTQSFANWTWYNVGTGFSQVAGGLATFTITDASSSAAYSDAEINDLMGDPPPYKWQNVSLEMRLRCSNDNASAGAGTRGWGLWNGSFGTLFGDPTPSNIIWFISVSPDSYDAFEGFKAYVITNDAIQPPVDLSGTDITQWHTYRVDRQPGSVLFAIDDNPVGTFANPPTIPLGVVIWIDNYVVTCSEDPLACERGFLDLAEDQSIEVDYVRITSLGGSPWAAATPAEASSLLGPRDREATGALNLGAVLLIPIASLCLVALLRRKR